MVSASGVRYEGDWIADCRSGMGVVTEPSGDRYEGTDAPATRVSEVCEVCEVCEV